MNNFIDSRIMEVDKGIEEFQYDLLTKDIKKDFHIITYYLAEKLPDNVLFDLKDWKILEFNENTILIESNDRKWYIKIHNIYSYDDKLCIEYTFYTIREK